MSRIIPTADSLPGAGFQPGAGTPGSRPTFPGLGSLPTREHLLQRLHLLETGDWAALVQLFKRSPLNLRRLFWGAPGP